MVYYKPISKVMHVTGKLLGGPAANVKLHFWSKKLHDGTLTKYRSLEFDFMPC